MQHRVPQLVLEAVLTAALWGHDQECLHNTADQLALLSSASLAVSLYCMAVHKGSDQMHVCLAVCLSMHTAGVCYC